MKFKKLCALLTALTLTLSFTACGFIPNTSSTPTQNENTDSQTSDSLDVSDDNSSDNTDSDENSNDSGNSSDTSSDTSSDSADGSQEDEKTPEINQAHCSIVDQAYALSKGETLGDGYTLTGEIIRIDEPYSNGAICLTFFVWGRETSLIYCYKLQGDGVERLQVGDYITVFGTIKNYKDTVEFDKNALLLSYESNTVLPDLSADPYANVTESEFYATYTPAKDSTDAYYRTLHGFMSGNIQTPDQAPELSPTRPMTQDGTYIRNTSTQFSADKKTYTVVDSHGNPAFEIYQGGGYIALEEVAAYVYAFGTYPANYTKLKNTDPDESVWGKYLRLNHTEFSGDTRSYPYEPVLPNITGCGGDLQYWEMDVGTTGTDCDPSFPIKIYNDGKTITRGAARIVYGKTDLNGNGVYEYGEHHVFYTYNHYNDFQEYLNYVGGWGEMFGNITGGGSISSKYDCNPTDYVPVFWSTLTDSQKSLAAVYKHRYQNSALFSL